MLFRRSNLIIVPTDEEQTRQHGTQCSRKQANGANITGPIRWSELGLIYLRADNAHQLATGVGQADCETSRRGALCSPDSLWPNQGEEGLRRRGGDHDEDVLRNGLFDRNEEDVADDLGYFDTQAGDPGSDALGVDEVCQTEKNNEDECERRLDLRVSSCKLSFGLFRKHTIVITCEIVVFEMPNS